MTVCTGEGKQLHTLLSHPMLSEHWDFTRKMLINILMHSSLFQSNLKMHIIYTTPIPHIFNEDKYYNILKLKNWETVTDRHREQKEKEREVEKKKNEKREIRATETERERGCWPLTMIVSRQSNSGWSLWCPVVMILWNTCIIQHIKHLHNTAHKTQTLHKAPAHKTPAQHSTYNICTIQHSWQHIKHLHSTAQHSTTHHHDVCFVFTSLRGFLLLTKKHRTHNDTMKQTKSKIQNKSLSSSLLYIDHSKYREMALQTASVLKNCLYFSIDAHSQDMLKHHLQQRRCWIKDKEPGHLQWSGSQHECLWTLVYPSGHAHCMACWGVHQSFALHSTEAG